MNDANDFKNELTAVADGEGWGAADWDPRRGEHPDDDLLVAYGSDRLAGDDHARIQEHLTTCPDCRALVGDQCDFPDLDAVAGEPSEFEVAAAWRKVSERLGEVPDATATATAAPPMPANDPPPLWKNPAVAWAVAAGLAFCAFGLFGHNLKLDHQLADSQSLVDRARQPAAVGLQDPEPETRGEGSAATCYVGEPCLVGIEPSAAALQLPAADLRWILVDAATDGEQFRGTLGESARHDLETEDAFALSLPVLGDLEPGRYEIRLHRAGDDRHTLHTQRFVMRQREAAGAATGGP